MKKLFASLMIATMLVPTGALASSTRPGSRVTHGSLNSKAKAPKCLVEEKWQPCEVVIDETGVKASEGHITKVVQWTTEEKDFNVAGGIVGGAAGAVIKQNCPMKAQIPNPAAKPTPAPAAPPTIPPAILKSFSSVVH